MRVLVTCGPAIAPIDEVRRITNFSTGSLGVVLANALAATGHQVVCYKGEAATTPIAISSDVEVHPFATNDDLLAQLRAAGPADVIFHAAALGDYEVSEVRDAEGHVQREAKIPSRAGVLTLTLRPATKVLPQLRDFFPSAKIVGWKYELDGTRADAVSAGARQLLESRTDLCVINGAAYGDGFGLLAPEGGLQHVADRSALCAALERMLS